MIDCTEDPMIVARRKPVQLAVRKSVRYNGNCMNQRKLYERVEELKGVGGVLGDHPLQHILMLRNRLIVVSVTTEV